MAEGFRARVCTPHGTVLDAVARSVRVPTETGQVGLRPRGEPLVLVVEPGLAVVRTADGARFAATAGGLLEADREGCALSTPFAAVGDSAAAVIEALERALATPDDEAMARRRLGELEQRIVHELRERPRAAADGADG